MNRLIEIFEEDIRIETYITIPLKHKIYYPSNATIDKSNLNSCETKNTLKVMSMDTLLSNHSLIYENHISQKIQHTNVYLL